MLQHALSLIMQKDEKLQSAMTNQLWASDVTSQSSHVELVNKQSESQSALSIGDTHSRSIAIVMAIEH